MTPSRFETWLNFINNDVTAPGGVWQEWVGVTVDWGYSGPLTNTVQVTALEGAAGAYTETTTASVTPALTVTKEAAPAVVQAGERTNIPTPVNELLYEKLRALTLEEIPLDHYRGQPEKLIKELG